MSSPWNKLGAGPVVVSLNEIMSEELAKRIEIEENQAPPVSPEDRSGPALLAEDSSTFLTDQDVNDGDCTNDFLLAQYLQMEFDREHDKQVLLEESKWNGTNKVSISFQNYRSIHPYEKEYVDSSDSEDEDSKEKRNHKIGSHPPPDFGPSGVICQNGEYVTKHDKVICGRKNTSRVLEFPPEFHTGDAHKMDVQLTNRVYNTLKLHSMNEEKRQHRVHEKKEKSTADFALDANTRLIIYKMIQADLLHSVSGSISTGKEANVLHAFGGTSSEEHQIIPTEVALKVYKTTLNEFKNRCEYVKDDYRYKNPRKVLKFWAEREMENLNRMRRAGIRCPSVVKLKKHVLVMSFVGQDGVGAPKLNEVDFNEDALRAAYGQCVDAVKGMFTQCNLVHGDLSEFNILYWQDQCWLIDVAQSMDLSHPQSLVFLARDCRNLTKFFVKRGLEVKNERELFNEVTGLNMASDSKFYVDVQEYANENRHVESRRDKKHPADCILRRAYDENPDAAVTFDDYVDES